MDSRISLSHPPKILRLDRSTHGRRRRESFRIDTYWVMHLYHYRGSTLNLKNHDILLEPGMVTLAPPGERTVYQFPHANCEHYYVFFQPTRKGVTQTIKLVYSPSEIPAEFPASFRLAIRSFHDRPDQSRAILWTMLWQLANISAPQVVDGPDHLQPVHPAFRKAQRIIKMDLRRSLKVNQIARDCGISHNQLTRLFRQFTGSTVTAYIQSQRLSQAEYLLRNSTLPIKLIAQECGIPDLHYFNKIIKASFGVPPSQMR